MISVKSQEPLPVTHCLIKRGPTDQIPGTPGSGKNAEKGGNCFSDYAGAAFSGFTTTFIIVT